MRNEMTRNLVRSYLEDKGVIFYKNFTEEQLKLAFPKSYELYQLIYSSPDGEIWEVNSIDIDFLCRLEVTETRAEMEIILVELYVTLREIYIETIQKDRSEINLALDNDEIRMLITNNMENDLGPAIDKAIEHYFAIN